MRRVLITLAALVMSATGAAAQTADVRFAAVPAVKALCMASKADPVKLAAIAASSGLKPGANPNSFVLEEGERRLTPGSADACRASLNK